LNRLRNLRLSTLCLALLNATLLALTISIFRTGQQRVHEPDNVPVHSLAFPDLAVMNAPSAAGIDMTAMREEAVFYSRRTFYHPPAQSQAVSTPDYDLAGVMSLPKGKWLAFVKRRSDQSNRTLHEGDDLEGWRIESIGSGRILIAHGEQRSELKSATPQAPQGQGLVRAAVTARGVQSGPRTLGSSGASTYPLPPPQTSTTTQTYQPPP
jgi:hypothetical protein